MKTIIFNSDKDIIKYLEDKLSIYESRFCIIDGIIHSKLVDKTAISIGFLEHAYFEQKKNDRLKSLNAELVEALKEIINEIETYGNASYEKPYEKAKQALKKAEL